PLAGVPVKAANEYLRRLVQQGFRVAICEQVEDPRASQGIVRREVIETITPGAAFSDDLLDGARNNFLCALVCQGTAFGMAAADLSTGELRIIGVAGDEEAMAAISRLSPREIIVPRGDSALPAVLVDTIRQRGVMVTERDQWEFDPGLARDDLTRHFEVASLDGFGIERDDSVVASAAGALLRYLRELQPAGIPHLMRPVIERPGGVMPLDEMTRRNLELVESLRGSHVPGDAAGTLLEVLDSTLTPMGARLLRQWILAPLARRDAIDERLDAVADLSDAATARMEIREALRGVRDIERLGSKAAAGRATPRELAALVASLGRLPALEGAVRRIEGRGRLALLLDGWDACAELNERISATLVEQPPIAIGDGETISPGFDSELDELRALRDGGKDGIARIQASERERTGINSLKVGYNRVFGYYIEVTRPHLSLVPPDYQRRQTLTGAERYVTAELKEYEERVLSAAERIDAREREIYEVLRAAVGAEIGRLQAMARTIAELDVLAALAEVAKREGYVRPVLTDDYDLDIVRGRHPVVERMMPREQFIPNDLRLTEDARVMILTGPNMAGKSTILRQAGLIVVMAQMGGFVPAESARLGVVDRLFTRVGASDNLVRGQSTFMVEMSETSAILNTATRRSLVLLDEIGRGTSTYDGVSIAWSVTEHLHDRIGCKTVFATHYHELTQLAGELVAVRNYNVAVREVEDRVLFLHRLEPGGANRSYGIEVGRLAGLPAEVLTRAREVLRLLEGEGEQLVPALAAPQARALAMPAKGDGDASPGQLALFASASHPVVERLRQTDPNTLSPMQALELLVQLVAAVARPRP
ncbi:MAG: DNA mismatch repair protein MutS, partial [Gemmatimonadaceae bacterium]